MIAYYDKRFPIAPGTDVGTAAEIHDRQSYRLVPWDSGRIGYRRFFTVSDLAAIRSKIPAYSMQRMPRSRRGSRTDWSTVFESITPTVWPILRTTSFGCAI